MIVAHRPVLAARASRMEPWARPALPDSDPTTHRAALVDLLAAIYLPQGTIFEMTGPECLDALAAARAAFVAQPPATPDWQPGPDGTETWDYAIDAVPELPACVTDTFEDELSMVLRFQRDTRGVLDVLLDPGYYAEPRFEQVLHLVVGPQPPAGDPPAEPRTTLFDPATAYLLAINGCGALPWAYDTFAAGSSYTDPEDSAYLEPGLFTSRYACSEDVPERDRSR